MSENTAEPQSKDKVKAQGTGVAYPIDTIDNILEDVRKIIAETGTGKPIPKEEISRILDKKVNSLSLYYSTLVQYNIFSLVHGKGYSATDLYRQYTNPKHDDGENKAKLQMFKSAPLYSKIIANLNDHQLPADVKRFANTLKDDPYNVNENSAERAAKVFFENCRNLHLIVNNYLRYSENNTGQSLPGTADKPPANDQKPPLPDENLFELPIPLDSKRKAFIRYPLNDLKKKDIKVIVKALSFIASSITEDGEDDFEIVIQTTKKDS